MITKAILDMKKELSKREMVKVTLNTIEPWQVGDTLTPQNVITVHCTSDTPLENGESEYDMVVIIKSDGAMVSLSSANAIRSLNATIDIMGLDEEYELILKEYPSDKPGRQDFKTVELV